MRCVFDTNVIISALLSPNSTPRRAFDRGQREGAVLLSAATLSELHQVLGRKRFRPYITVEETRRFLTALVRESEWVIITTSVAVCRDPADNKFLEIAVSGRATHIVTGDDDLLSLHPFQGIHILSPQSFLNVI